jgi:hypothetical protein
MEIRAKIGLAKRQLNNMSNVLDELYQDVMAVKKVKLKELPPVKKDEVIEQVMRRMVYLNRIKNKPLMEVNARLDELSRLLDWLEG